MKRLFAGVAVAQQFGVGEADQREAVALDLLGARRVIGLPQAMLAAVELDRQPAVGAEEVDRIAEQQHLLPELQPVETPVAQERPQHLLGLRCTSAELSSETALLGGQAVI